MSCVTKAGYREAEKIRAEGITDAANIRRVGAIAMAIDNASQLISNYKKQRDISDRMLAIAEDERKHAQQTYWPRELEFLNEFGTPEEVELADVYGRRFAGHLIAPIAKAFAIQIQKQKCGAGRYCTSQFIQNMQQTYQAHATAVACMKVVGYVKGFLYAQAKHGLNDDRRLKAVALGKDLVGQAATLYKQAAGGLASRGGDLIAGFNNALAAFGFAEQHSKDSVGSLANYARDAMANRTEGNANFKIPDSYNTMYDIPVDTTDYNVLWDSSAITDTSMYNGNIGFSYDVNGGSSSALNFDGDVGMQAQVNDMFRDDAAPFTNNTFDNIKTATMDSGNEGDVGKRDLVRTGTKTYTFTDSDGDRGQITVDMSDFKLAYADKYHPVLPGDDAKL